MFYNVIQFSRKSWKKNLQIPIFQVLTFVIDYGKERSLTAILNPVLNDPRIKEKFAVNFKEVSWNNFRYEYSLARDSAVEVDTSVIYTSKTFIPRSVQFNLTLHAFGGSVNFLTAHLRLQGLDEALQGFLIDKLTSEKLMKKLMEKPEQLLDILKLVASKVRLICLTRNNIVPIFWLTPKNLNENTNTEKFDFEVSFYIWSYVLYSFVYLFSNNSLYIYSSWKKLPKLSLIFLIYK